MKLLLTYSPFSHRPSNILSTPQNFCISKLFSVSLMITAYSKEKLKTILKQNFGGKWRCIIDDVKIMVNKSLK